VPELGGDFSVLMKRMKLVGIYRSYNRYLTYLYMAGPQEGYVNIVKVPNATDADHAQHYVLGPRFYLEVSTGFLVVRLFLSGRLNMRLQMGKPQLLKSYFAAIGQDLDAKLLAEVRRVRSRQYDVLG
jgi:hypothetical protein